MFVVKGETGRFCYALSSALRPLGGTFDKSRKEWLVPDDKQEVAAEAVSKFPGLSLVEDATVVATQPVEGKVKRDLSLPVNGVAVAGTANQGGARWWPLYYCLRPLGGVFDKANNCWVVPADKVADAAQILAAKFEGLTIAVQETVQAQPEPSEPEAEAKADEGATFEPEAKEAATVQDSGVPDVLTVSADAELPEALPVDKPKKKGKKAKAQAAA